MHGFALAIAASTVIASMVRPIIAQLLGDEINIWQRAVQERYHQWVGVQVGSAVASAMQWPADRHGRDSGSPGVPGELKDGGERTATTAA